MLDETQSPRQSASGANGRPREAPLEAPREARNEKSGAPKQDRSARVHLTRGSKLIKRDESRRLAVAQMEETNLEMLNHLMTLEDDIFGEESVGEWFMVSNVHHGNVLVLLDLPSYRPVGIAILMRDWDDPDRCYLSDFGVKEGYRGRGLGTYFLGAVLEEVRDMNLKSVSLTVDVNNEAAIGLYRKFGFEIVDERQNLYGEGRHRYLMDLEVTPAPTNS